MSFTLSQAPLDPAALHRRLLNASAGACVTFEGWVRDQNGGRRVLGLDYEAYLPLAEKEGERIIAEARARYPLLAAVAVHRTGQLALGDLAVWIGVSAAHRGDAFEGCRYIIDQAKARLPVWKRERYADGESAWINCVIKDPA